MKLNARDVVEINRLYATTMMSYRDIGKLFHVSYEWVRQHVSRDSEYAHAEIRRCFYEAQELDKEREWHKRGKFCRVCRGPIQRNTGRYTATCSPACSRFLNAHRVAMDYRYGGEEAQNQLRLYQARTILRHPTRWTGAQSDWARRFMEAYLRGEILPRNRVYTKPTAKGSAEFQAYARERDAIERDGDDGEDASREVDLDFDLD